MTRRTTSTLILEIEMIEPGVQLFHVRHFGRWRDLYLYRDAGGRLRAAWPQRNLPTPLAGTWIDDMPPLAAIIDAAFPEVAA